MTQYQKLIEYFNGDNPDGDGFYFDTHQFFLDMDEYWDEQIKDNYYGIHLQDKINHVNTFLKIYKSKCGVYIRTAIGFIPVYDENSSEQNLFYIINKKIEQSKIKMLEDLQMIMNQ